MNEFNLIITGDPLIDVWSYGTRDDYSKRWNESHRETRSGGAVNTHDNAWYIKGKYSNKRISVWSEYHRYEQRPTLTRYMDKEKDELLLEVLFKDGHTDPKKMCKVPPQQNGPFGSRGWSSKHWDTYQNGLVISEYNKGSCNSPTKRYIPPCVFGIVDSRYRTLDMSWLDSCKLKIWHATGSEWDHEWSKQFDYTIKTDGPNRVLIFHRGQLAGRPIGVPPTEIVDTIGAGDTFTAAVAVWLANETINGEDASQLKTIQDATRFGIWCAQDVITKNLTAVCQRTLEEYLGLDKKP